MKYLFSGQPELRQACEHLLRVQPDKVTPEQLLQDMLEQVRRAWSRLPPHHCFAHVPTPLQGETLSPFAEAATTLIESGCSFITTGKLVAGVANPN
jgi:hypothetical protein